MMRAAIVVLSLTALSCVNEPLSRKQSMLALYGELTRAVSRSDRAWLKARSLDVSFATNGLRAAILSNEFTSLAYDPEVDADRGTAILPAGSGYWVISFSFDESCGRWSISRIGAPQ